MKNKILATMAIFGMVASASAVKINDNLSINGFIDGSYTLTDADTGDTQKLQGDEVELNVLLSNGNVSGMISIDSDKSADENDLDIEQAHFTYDLGNGISITAGRYGSALGLEREDPAGLYTVSRAYNSNSFNIGDIDENAVEGVTLSYAADSFSVAASLENGTKGANLESDELNLSFSFSYTALENTVIGGGYFFDNQAESTQEVDMLNIHASRSFGKLLIAAEYSELSGTSDTDAYLLLADYDYNDKIGAVIRFSNEEQAAGDYEKLTIAPNYSITDNLGAILEYSDIENAGTDSDQIAIELTYTF